MPTALHTACPPGFEKLAASLNLGSTHLDIQFPALLQVMAHSMYFMKTGIASKISQILQFQR